MNQIFQDRREAGRQLALKLPLSEAEKDSTLFLALPRGGVPIAFEISRETGLPFDVLIVSKIGHPLHPEYGIGAVTEGGFHWIDPRAIGLAEIPAEELHSLIEQEKKEVARRIQEYRPHRALPDFRGKNIILVDDGIATGVTARVAAQYVRSQGAKSVKLAVPVCAAETARKLQGDLDEVICFHQSENFSAVSLFFHDFRQLGDQEVLDLLCNSRRDEGTLLRHATAHAVPLRETRDLRPLIEKIAGSRIVMLGEASHGTQEFYEWRRLISQELIAEHGFHFIAVEGDWPACAHVHRFIRGETREKSAREALQNFRRWPTWMWANTEMIAAAEWLREHNAGREGTPVGFHGLDVYSLFESIDEVLRQLREIDPAMARRARLRYECFEPFRRDEKAYAKSLVHFPEGCERQVLESLQELLATRLEGLRADRLLDLQQNARIVKNAEDYYRTMIHGDEDSWNVRDRHMMETLDQLLKHYGPGSKAIVWAHNTHIGDHRATEMQQQGLVNIGGLAREKWGEDQVSLVGFSTYEGEVIASPAWDGPVEITPVPPGRPLSYEEIFQDVSRRIAAPDFFLWLKEEPLRKVFRQTRGHRAIGVVYNPAYERHGNYVPSALSDRYDALLFFSKTRALTPLRQEFSRSEIPETWPRGT
ncbi:MAG: erythromycin esterase family protein [Bdellovibrionaceae bacterium]|nr:erythromycin esterase family protein [Pseudobdellovibrionaceae bacterium]